MEGKELVKQGEFGITEEVAPIADDTMVLVAQRAEQRVEAVKKITRIALSITNATDWTDQGGKPYLAASGSEKIANLFGINWQIDEPRCEYEDDGHFTYTYMGTFTIAGRSIQVEGSRSSKDPFFKKYKYVDDGTGTETKIELPISAIDKRDVKMSAMTNLLGNGITRLLGIRNLTWDDLQAYAGISRAAVTSKVKYQQNKPPITEPQKRPLTDPNGTVTDPQIKAIGAILSKLGINDDLAQHEKVSQVLKLPETVTSMRNLTKQQASDVIDALGKGA